MKNVIVSTGQSLEFKKGERRFASTIEKEAKEKGFKVVIRTNEAFIIEEEITGCFFIVDREDYKKSDSLVGAISYEILFFSSLQYAEIIKDENYSYKYNDIKSIEQYKKIKNHFINLRLYVSKITHKKFSKELIVMSNNMEEEQITLTINTKTTTEKKVKEVLEYINME